MNENDSNLAVKQQIVEKITKAKHVLLTIPKSPSVDEMSAAIGMSLLLDKLDKRPSIVFSGSIPSAVEFLNPGKHITKDIDGLRDFIIALSKDKADKLRWKLEDDIVKIYITPYKSSLGQADLEFQQGEFNVELVIALGVANEDNLDEVLQAHGKILHDAPIIGINAGNIPSGTGSINWQDQSAGSICEMIVAISDAFGSNLLDEPIATAFLTGIVAKTNRFSNELTTPKLMTMSAQLMAAGANQQLIATNLGTPSEINEGEEASIKKAPDMPSEKRESHDNTEEMNVDHEEDKGESNKSDKPPIEIPKNSNGEQVNSDDIKSELEKTSDDTMNKIDETGITKEGEATANSEAQEGGRGDDSNTNSANHQGNSLIADGLLNDTTKDTQTVSNSRETAGGEESSIKGGISSSDTQSKEGDSPSIVGDDARHKVTTPPEYGGTLNSINSQDSDSTPEVAVSAEDTKLMDMTKGIDQGIDPQKLADTDLLSGETKDIYADVASDIEALVPPPQGVSESLNPVDAARQAVLDASHTISGPQQFEENIQPSVPEAPVPYAPAQSLVSVPSESMMQSSNLDTTNALPIIPPPLPPLPDDVNMPLPPLPPLPPNAGMAVSPMLAPPIPPAGEYPQQGGNLNNAINDTNYGTQVDVPVSAAPNDPSTFPLPPVQ